MGMRARPRMPMRTRPRPRTGLREWGSPRSSTRSPPGPGPPAWRRVVASVPFVNSSMILAMCSHRRWERSNVSGARHTSHRRLADDQLRREDHAARRAVLIPDELEQRARRLCALFANALADGRERRVEMSGKVEVVEPGQRHVVGNAEAAGADR